MKKAYGILVAILLTIILGTGVYVVVKKESLSIPNLETAVAGSTKSNQASKKYARAGKEAWDAFHCSAWASVLENEKEEDRLFAYGYKRGLEFTGAFLAKKITQEDKAVEIPLGVTVTLNGPTPNKEFLLGRLFESAWVHGVNQAYLTRDGNFNDDNVRLDIAEKNYNDGKCQSMGK